jgi:hypothetical protein
MASLPGQKGTAGPLPNQVLGLTATVVSAGQVNLAWTAVSNASSYNVFRAGVLIGNPAAVSFADTGVAPNTTYSYTVQGVNGNGVGLASAPATVTTPPAQVTGLVATALSSSSIGLSWNVDAGANTYTVERGASVVGTPSGTSFTDTGLAASTLYSYQVAANGAGGQGAFSVPASATTQAGSGGAITWNPGIRVRFGEYATMDTLANMTATMDSIVALDVHNQIKGLCISPTWAQLEGATLGDYSAGFAVIGPLISHLKSYNPPRDLTIEVNCGGNGWTPQTGFLPGFCPSYMNNSTYGGGMTEGTTRPFIVFWNQNVVNRLIALFGAYYAQFGYDTPTGGIYRWDPIQEISVDANAAGYSPSALLAVWPSLMSGLRSAVPRSLVMVKPTFINPSNGSSYPGILSAALSNHISMASEDSTQTTFTANDWGQQAYLGAFPGFATTDYTSNNGGNPGWDFHCNVDPAELWNNSSSAAIPPATTGSGYVYDVGSTGGVWTKVKRMKATHVDIYVSGFGSCPMINRLTFASGVTANPPLGPAPGSTATRPNIIDMLTGNTSYSGVVPANTVIPWTTYPAGYP